MTDAEIIKALECHIGYTAKRCPNCAYTVYGCDCLEKLHHSLYDLINRQKEEIESLESRIFALNDTNKMLIDSQEIYWKNRVKEFAERLKARIREYIFISELEFQCEEVDNLVKEMTEKNE